MPKQHNKPNYRSLYWKLFFLLVIGIVCLFWVVNQLIVSTEERMSFIDKPHQETLRSYASEAERLYELGDINGLSKWLQEIREKENTWVAVIEASAKAIAGSHIPEEYEKHFVLGRGIDWKVHLYFNFNPNMGVRFTNSNTHFLIQLPQRMRPGKYWEATHLLLHIALPSIILLVIVHLLYRHIMKPLRRLKRATQEFSEGNFSIRTKPELGARNDELTDLANAFDSMAERVQNLIETQRLLIADLSHEMRTPITRMELALAAHTQEEPEALARITKDLADMRQLTQDTLALAWLETEKPKLNEEEVDLVDLLECIVESAQFEFPEHQITCLTSEEALIRHTNHRALGQAFENIIRNALKYTPRTDAVSISLTESCKHYQIVINDGGPGVPEEYLEKIFTPFFRVDKSRGEDAGGFGLGLSLAKRQIEAVGGTVTATNRYHIDKATRKGLTVSIVLPMRNQIRAK